MGGNRHERTARRAGLSTDFQMTQMEIPLFPHPFNLRNLWIDELQGRPVFGIVSLWFTTVLSLRRIGGEAVQRRLAQYVPSTRHCAVAGAVLHSNTCTAVSNPANPVILAQDSSVSGTAPSHDRYLYRGYLRIAALDMLNTAAVIHTVVWDPTEPVATRPLLLTANGNPLTASYYTYGFDQVKNVTELFDSSGNIAATYDFGPFGEDMTAIGPAAAINPFRFSSEVWDGPLGLVDYNFRSYNPLDGRFINRDPLEEEGGMNLYGFINNYALNGYDIFGLKPKRCADECPYTGYTSDSTPVALDLDPIDPISNDMVNSISLLGSLPTGLSPADMAKWIMGNMAGVDSKIIDAYKKAILSGRPWYLYITMDVKICEGKSCCFFFTKQKKISCRGIYKCAKGPIAGSWLPGTRTSALDGATLHTCWKEAEAAMASGNVKVFKNE
jgi:RHS repeat-associated protein